MTVSRIGNRTARKPRKSIDQAMKFRSVVCIMRMTD